MRLAQDIGRRVRRIRKDRGLSAHRLAVASGITSQHVYVIEAGKGNPKIETLEALATALGVRLRDLVDPDEEPESLAA